jgi:hypothetical protein
VLQIDMQPPPVLPRTDGDGGRRSGKAATGKGAKK